MTSWSDFSPTLDFSAAVSTSNRVLYEQGFIHLVIQAASRIHAVGMEAKIK